jgi:8-oxo-dGTP diphosphatase
MNHSHPVAPVTREHFVGAGVVVLRNGETGHEVLLIRRDKPPRKWEWSIPGGRQELGETVREAAIREIKEETGLIVTNLELVDVVDAFRTDSRGNVETQWTLIDFLAWWAGDTVQAGSDASEARWVPITELDGYNLWSETSRVIVKADTLSSSLEKTK